MRRSTLCSSGLRKTYMYTEHTSIAMMYRDDIGTRSRFSVCAAGSAPAPRHLIGGDGESMLCDIRADAPSCARTVVRARVDHEGGDAG